MEERFGHVGKLYEHLLCAPGETWDPFFVCDGAEPSEADLAGYAGIAVTGSAEDAFSDTPWVARLRRMLAALARREQRILGMCFGCQVLAVALQGDAGRAAAGMEAGVREILFTSDAAAGAPRQCADEARRCAGAGSIRIHEVHQDGVSRLPPGAALLARSANCAVEAWALGDHVLCIQGHVEFSAAFMDALMAWREREHSPAFAAGLAARARAEVRDTPVTAEGAALMRALCLAFLKGRAGGAA